MDINLIVNITSKAWALPILAKLHDGIPARQAALLLATGATRTAFRQSIDHLISIGLIERNPGFGHPLRPEFRLTQSGQVAAEMADEILSDLENEALVLLRRSWTLPVLTTLRKPQQFATIKRSLGAISDRALSQSLRGMESRQWIKRQVDIEARPPRPIYSSVNLGAVISDATRMVALH